MTANTQAGKFLGDEEGGLNATGRVILMRERGQPESRDDGDSLVIHVDLIDTALVPIHGPLNQPRNRLGIFQFRMLIEIRQVDEEHGHTPEFRYPTALTRCESIDDRARDVSAQGILHTLRYHWIGRRDKNGGWFI